MRIAGRIVVRIACVATATATATAVLLVQFLFCSLSSGEPFLAPVADLCHSRDGMPLRDFTDLSSN